MPMAICRVCIFYVLAANFRMSVFEDKVFVVDVDDDRLVFVYSLSEYVFRQTVEHQAVYDSFDRTGAEFGVIAFVGEIRQGCRCHFKLYAAAAS